MCIAVSASPLSPKGTIVKLKCKEAFGNFVPGDELDVPDGAIYDKAFFGEVPATPVTEDVSRLENDGAPPMKGSK
jgi:hypothetical protein